LPRPQGARQPRRVHRQGHLHLRGTGPTHHHISQLTTSADRSRLLTMD
uniref:Uncharacterized protein n=1 Tax=Aegilops tauschii subsp. strangulata TaxID=200361 RepID=A0A453GG13_AEGTS